MKKKPFSLQRAALKLLCSLLGILLLGMLAITLLARESFGRIAYADPGSAPSLTQEEVDARSPVQYAALADTAWEVIAPEEISFPVFSSQIGGEDSGIINILLIGRDAGESFSRSDSLILCSFQPEKGSLTLTSLLRDLYVKIPGYRDNRINAAYAAGGMPLLKQTLMVNLGIHVDGCLEVDFTQFSRIIDLFGGVALELRQDEADAINAAVPGELEEGMQWLTGSQALAYSRIRKLDSDGDFSRTNRQRKVLTALLKSYQDANLSALFSAVKEALPMMTTDMNRRELLNYAAEILPAVNDLKIASQHIPAEGTYAYRMIRDMSVIVADMEENHRILAESLQ